MRRQYHLHGVSNLVGYKRHGICHKEVQCRVQKNHQDRTGQYRVRMNHKDVKVQDCVRVNHQDMTGQCQVRVNHRDNKVQYRVRVNHQDMKAQYRVRMNHQLCQCREAMPIIHRNLIDNKVDQTLGRVPELQKSTRFILE